MTNSVKIASLLDGGALTFPEIMERTGMKYAAARSAINLLLTADIIEAHKTAPSGRMGRPLVRYALLEIA